MEVAERQPFPASSAAGNDSEIANCNSLWEEMLKRDREDVISENNSA